MSTHLATQMGDYLMLWEAYVPKVFTFLGTIRLKGKTLGGFALIGLYTTDSVAPVPCSPSRSLFHSPSPSQCLSFFLSISSWAGVSGGWDCNCVLSDGRDDIDYFFFLLINFFKK